MVLGIIPARYASTRFPGKPLVDILGKSMVQRVIEQVQQTKLVDEVVVATDDNRIFEHVESLGFQVFMTDPNHPSGTDRCIEVSKDFPEAEIIVNIQGDEPFIQPQQIDDAIRLLLDEASFEIATLAKKIEDKNTLFNPNCVKAIFAASGQGIYFSRHPIPYVRGIQEDEWLQKADFYKHIGLYVFRKEALKKIEQLSPSRLERLESLEQLRWLENGLQIRIGKTQFESIGIDSPEDLDKAIQKQ